MRFLAFLFAAVAAALVISLQADATRVSVRTLVWRSDPCLAQIVDRENPPWEPTLYNGGSRWRGGPMLRRSYGLPQALPPSKMASAGRDWRTNPWTQLRWMRGYVNGRYGGSCKALAFWRTNGWY
jgi:hypothetical protein